MALPLLLAKHVPSAFRHLRDAMPSNVDDRLRRLGGIPLCVWKKTYSITSFCNPRFNWSANGWFQKERCYYIFHTNHTALAFNSPCCWLHSTLLGLKQHSSWNVQTSFLWTVTSSRISAAYLLMALKMVTELQLLWSIETILSVFDYLIYQASSDLNYMHFCLQQTWCNGLKKKIF